jgi:histidine triad (HIT) family protein
MPNCVFCQIVSHELPKDFLYEDREVMVFKDISPLKPVHLLFVPKAHIHDFLSLDNDALLSKIRKLIQQQIKENRLENRGFRVVVNGGGLQKVDHLHFHLTGPHLI